MKNYSTEDIMQVAASIKEVDHYFLSKAQQQVNTAMTVRNWFIGAYIVEYELKGVDRAAYGEKILRVLASKLTATGLKGMSATNLKLFRQFYQTYPHIGGTVNSLWEQDGSHRFMIGQTVSDQSFQHQAADLAKAVCLLQRLTFSHFIELIKLDTPRRFFYEKQIIDNNWSIRDLKRAISGLLFERTGLSPAGLSPITREPSISPSDLIRDPYILEFLQLSEKPSLSELKLEEAIIDHLQSFLLELGKGFCFEARQKRITFDNTHYRVDLVFYHRILKCHILIDLKLGDFSHADAGQMNVYLNYYREHETLPSDNPPVGIILCAGKNENLVKYATAGLSHQVFVSKYLINLPTEAELARAISQERIGK